MYKRTYYCHLYLQSRGRWIPGPTGLLLITIEVGQDTQSLCVCVCMWVCVGVGRPRFHCIHCTYFCRLFRQSRGRRIAVVLGYRSRSGYTEHEDAPR